MRCLDLSTATMYLIAAWLVPASCDSILYVPGDPERLTCGESYTLVCDINPPPKSQMIWANFTDDISTCLSFICSNNLFTPAHYQFTFGGSPYNLTINTVKITDDGASITCRDVTVSDPIDIGVEVVTDDSTTSIEGIYNGNNINFTMTACVFPVANLKVKWEKESVTDNQKSVLEEDNTIDTTTALPLCQSSTDCSTNGISSDIQVLSDNTTGSEYYICIEIKRDNVIIFQKCTTTSYKLKGDILETTTDSVSLDDKPWCIENWKKCLTIIIPVVVALIIVIVIILCICKFKKLCCFSENGCTLCEELRCCQWHHICCMCKDDKVDTINHGIPEPTDLKAEFYGKGSCKLTWQSGNGGDSQVKGYNVEMMEGTEDWKKINIDLVTHIIFVKDGLLKGSRVSFRILAVNKFAVSRPSAATTPHKVIYPPGAPTLLKAEFYGEGCCRLTWNRPSDDGGSHIKGYIIEKEEDGKWKQCNSKPTKVTEFDVKDLVKGTMVRFRVKAVNDVGESEPCKPTDSRTVLYPPTAPKVLKTEFYGEGCCGITWHESADDGGSHIIGYIIEKKTHKDWIQCTNDPVPYTMFTVTALGQGLEVQFRVKAVNDIGKSKPSNVTGRQKVEYAGVTPGAPNTLEMKKSNDKGCCELKWNKPDEESHRGITGYIIEKLEEHGVWNKCNATPVPKTLFTVHGLHEGVAVTLRVKSAFKDGESEPSNIVRYPHNPPGRPSGLRMKFSGKGSCHLQWNKTDYDGNCLIKGYIIEKEEHGQWSQCNSEPTQVTVFDVKDLVKGMVVRFRVKAVNDVGESEPCKPTDSCTVLFPPDAPTDLQSKFYGKGCCKLTWTAPDDDGGCPIKGYIIDINKQKWAKHSALHEPKTEFTVTDLVEGQVVKFRVKAFNEVGNSNNSKLVGPYTVKYITVHEPPDETQNSDDDPVNKTSDATT